MVQAHMWFNLAFSAFDWGDLARSEAYERRNGLEARMSFEEIREAQRLASEWSATKER